VLGDIFTDLEAPPGIGIDDAVGRDGEGSEEKRTARNVSFLDRIEIMERLWLHPPMVEGGRARLPAWEDR
jgi:hypothetical protein